MDELLWRRVEAWAERRPDQPAMRCRGEELTYSQFSQRTSQLAEVLVASGVRRGDRVGLYLGKSLHTAIGVYGVLKAGAAYVPIDPTAPVERVQAILADCGIQVLISQPDKIRRLPPDHSLSWIVGSADSERFGGAEGIPWSVVEQAEGAMSPVTAAGSDLAYVMYTSGSTGTPKGLMHTHASGLAYTRLSAELYQVTHEDRLGNHSPLHFDMSTFEFLTGPQQGATTVILPEEATFFPRSMAELIEREKLTFWYSVPLALIQLLEHGELETRDMSSLRWVLFGGEPFAPKHLKRLMELWPTTRFSNVYGPAEVNQCTYYHLPGPLQDLCEPLPLGRVWNETRGRVVGEGGADVAIGEVGELWISSPTMMRGYWGRPDLDVQAFADFEGDRYYRTGDLVQVLDSESLAFIGRKDRQVKVRGYRVELDEVEAVLTAHPDVVEVGVVAPKSEDGVRRIVAAVRVHDGAPVTAEMLRSLAAETVPAYAVPETIEVRASLPHTTSGKVDRMRLTQDFERPGLDFL